MQLGEVIVKKIKSNHIAKHGGRDQWSEYPNLKDTLIICKPIDDESFASVYESY